MLGAHCAISRAPLQIAAGTRIYSTFWRTRWVSTCATASPHGLHGVVGAVDASLLIQAALRLAAMSITPVEDPPTPPPGAAPS